MSKNDVEKTTKEILGDSKSATAKALIIVAMSMDNMTAAIIENQKKVDDRITNVETKFDSKFYKIRFFSFIAEFWWMIPILIVAVTIIIIWSAETKDPTGAIKLFK